VANRSQIDLTQQSGGDAQICAFGDAPKGWLFYATPRGVKLAEMKNGSRQIGLLEKQLRTAIEQFRSCGLLRSAHRSHPWDAIVLPTYLQG